MALPALPCDVLAEATSQVARAAFPKGHPSMRRRDARGPISTTPTCAALLSPTGRPAAAPAQLALLTVRPGAAGRADAPAAEAVRARLDWQDALALAVSAPGCDAAVLRACRQRRLTGHAALLLCATRLTLGRAQGLRTAPGRQRTDSPPVLAALPTRQRLACGGATRRQALTVRAPAAPRGTDGGPWRWAIAAPATPA
jgi:transposase